MFELSSEHCTGCGACMNVCPQNAIQMQANKEGFYYPVIGKDCVGCGLCQRVCPVCASSSESCAAVPACYAAQAKDENLRAESSSGGVFSLLAQYVFERGGYVCGVKMTAPDEASHVLLKDEKELKALRGSKYVQSKTGLVFREIKKLLDAGTAVLFSGTPCQVAGLKSFLQKSYDNLLTVDLVCHGAPSPLALKKYVEEHGCREIINFRDKSQSWKHQNISYGSNRFSYDEDDYMRAFLSDLSTRKSCSSCPFARLPREGDFTLGDFWGIGKYNKNLDDDKGTSLVLLNTPKAEKIFKTLPLKLKKSVPFKIAVKGNATLQKSYPAHINREVFFEVLQNDSFKQALSAGFDVSKNVAVLNFWSTLNYGAILTAYALQEVIKRNGFRPYHVYYVKSWAREKYLESFSRRFAEKYLQMTPYVETVRDFKKLNDGFASFIVGSDQVFNLEYMAKDMEKYLLGFVRPEKRKIALAASFGDIKPDLMKINQKLMQICFDRFQALSVREKQGESVFKQWFGLKAMAVFDPVFALDKKTWQKPAADSKKDFPKRFIAAYVLDDNPEFEALLQKQAQKYRAEIVRIDGSFEVEDWLKAFDKACFVVTDSFHGVCFSLIFEKHFICIGNKSRGLERFCSLFAALGLDKKLIALSDYAQAKTIAPDYRRIKSKISEQALKTESFLLKALQTAVEPTTSGETAAIRKLLKKEEIKNKLCYIFRRLCSKICFGKKRKYHKDMARAFKVAGKNCRKLRKFLK